MGLLHPAYVEFPFDGENPVDWSTKTVPQRRRDFLDQLDQYKNWEARLLDAEYRVIGSTGYIAGSERLTREPKSGALPTAGAAAEQRLLRTALEAPRWANVPLVDARILRVLTEASNATQVVELGASTGFSALWICNALRKNGGRLTTFELDPKRAAIARQEFQRAGVDHLVTLVEGDAYANIAALKGPIDYLAKLLPLVRPGGLIIAHNMRWPAPSPAYVKAVTTDPTLETVFVNVDDQGIGITLKKR